MKRFLGLVPFLLVLASLACFSVAGCGGEVETSPDTDTGTAGGADIPSGDEPALPESEP
jgi:hypothetical protein